MEVILSKDVEKIGKAGSVIKVKDGYARNYLLPHKLAVSANNQNLLAIQQKKQKQELAQQKNQEQAEGLKNKLAGLSLTIPVLVQKEDKLYGSITAVEIANVLKDEGFEIDKSCIVLDEPIKSLGIFEVAIKLHPDVTAQIKIWIVKK